MLNNKNILDKVRKIHFVGIGGSGMCPMAEILKNQGYDITGSDIYASDTLERIKEYGIPVFMDHKKENINGAELVVYSAAIKKDNPEIVAAIAKELPVVERSEMLGMLTSRYKNAIAVSGTHGKTTTTAMITQILTNGEKDPTSIIGGKLSFIGGNSRIGKSENIICEACEYVDSFLQLEPNVAVILNVDADHLDYFKTMDNIIKSFNQFAQQTRNLIVVNGDDQNAMKTVEGATAKVVTFGLSDKCDFYASSIFEDTGESQSFKMINDGQEIAQITLNVPGKHNIYNALAAAVVSYLLGVERVAIEQSLREFIGVHRRFEIIGEHRNVLVVDDFAHHPTELIATLDAAKSMGYNRVLAVFQPHTYSRTYMLLDDFANALSIADKVIISEILPVREENIYNIHAKDLVDKIDGAFYISTFEEIADFVNEIAQPGDLVITMGGGNVYLCANMIFDKLQNS